MPPCRKTVVGKTYKKKRWAKRFAHGRPVRHVKSGYRIGKKRGK